MPIAKEYTAFVRDLKSRVVAARLRAARSVNRELILLYWDIGRAIAEKQRHLGWGEAVVEKVAADLRRSFPGLRGFSARNVRDMRRFYLAYSDPTIWRQAVAKLEQTDPTEFLRQAVAEIPWGQNLLILNKVSDPAARQYYLHSTARFGWSRNVLRHQIKARAFERSHREIKSHNFPAVLPEHLAEQAEEALKSSYNLEFLGIGRTLKERDLENQLVSWLRDFLLELGYGFCFVGRQHRLALGTKEYFVDLLFYHRFLKALVAIDLKIGSFEPEYSGKMDFYLNLLNERERAPDDRPSIGIILCAEKDNLEVEYALRSKGNPIGVAAYRLQSSLPAKLRGKLPTARQLGQAVRRLLPSPTTEDPPASASALPVLPEEKKRRRAQNAPPRARH